MEIKLKEIAIRDLVAGYENDNEEGVRAFGGNLDIRPPYQREFVYSAEEQMAVIRTVAKGFPLNVMYWAQRDIVGNASERCNNDNDTPDNGTLGSVPHYEIIDGQQRTLSICEYIDGNFSVKFGDDHLPYGFSNLPADRQKQILDYKLTIYICSGTDGEKLDWFRTINIAGKKLEEQELRNAVYAGSFVTAAKRKFSKSGCVAYKIGNRYLNGECNRQKYLETVIRWIANSEQDYMQSKDPVSDYMQAHQHDANADALWLYFQNVINWVQAKFPKYRKEMKGVAWGILYNQHKDDTLDATALETEVARLMQDSDVQRKSGIYAYVLDGDEHHLDLRAFDDNTKREVYERQQGICPVCKKHFEIEQMQGDHITPWCRGGRTVADNCQMLCRKCNNLKSGN